MTDIQPFNCNWTLPNGNHDGGVSCGVGFTISWQRGSLIAVGRNGAFLIEVLQSCRHQLSYYQDSKFACEENAQALEALDEAIARLQSRRDRRQTAGTLGTHIAD